jgi:T-complex protein 1 subunit theta
MQQGETKGTVLMKNADDLLNYTRGEEDKFEGFIKKLAEAGV